MKKTLIRVDNLDAFICHGGGTIYIDSGLLLTPGAKDELNKRGIAILYEACPKASSCPHAPHGAARVLPPDCTSLEELVLGLAALLQKECGVTDPAQLRELSLQAVHTIQENL